METDWYSRQTPVGWVGSIGNAIQVSMVDGSSIEGWLYTVDPLHHHVVLLTPASSISNKLKSVVLLGHAIRDLECECFLSFIIFCIH